MSSVFVLEDVARDAVREGISSVITVYLFPDGDVRVGQHGVASEVETIGILNYAAARIADSLLKETCK